MPRWPRPMRDPGRRGTAAPGGRRADRHRVRPGSPGPARARRGRRHHSRDDRRRGGPRLATDLRAVPGIERFAALRLADLETGGPRPLRTMWRVSREQLDQRYGGMTIGELLDRYGGAARPGT